MESPKGCPASQVFTVVGMYAGLRCLFGPCLFMFSRLKKQFFAHTKGWKGVMTELD